MGQLRHRGVGRAAHRCLASLPKACQADRVQGHAASQYVEGHNPTMTAHPKTDGRLRRRNGPQLRRIDHWRLLWHHAGTSGVMRAALDSRPKGNLHVEQIRRALGRFSLGQAMARWRRRHPAPRAVAAAGLISNRFNARFSPFWAGETDRTASAAVAVFSPKRFKRKRTAARSSRHRGLPAHTVGAKLHRFLAPPAFSRRRAMKSGRAIGVMRRQPVLHKGDTLAAAAT